VTDQNRDRPFDLPLPPWLTPRARALLREPLIVCLILIVLTSLFFAVFPRFDVWFCFICPAVASPPGRCRSRWAFASSPATSSASS
jgi:hypothetical protein